MDGLYTVAGFAVGFIVGITGVGGGALMTPALVLGFGIPPVTAVGTDLLYAALTKFGGSWAHSRKGTVDWQVVRRLATGSVPMALLSVWLLHALGLGEGSLKTLITAVLSAALMLTAFALLVKPYLPKPGAARGEAAAVEPARYVAGATVLAGALLGALVAISSVGAGALGVVLLQLLYPRAPALRIVGTDIAHAVPLTLIAGLGHVALGSVDFALLGGLLLGSLPGIWLGSHIGGRIPESFLRPLLAVMLLLVGGRVVFA